MEFKKVKRVVFIFLSIILLAAVFYFGYNAYLYLKISQPSFFQKNAKQNQTKENQEVLFACPVPKQYCQKAEPIYVRGQYFGLGFKVPQNTPFLAVFDGWLETGGMMMIVGQLGARSPAASEVGRVMRSRARAAFGSGVAVCGEVEGPSV